MLVEQAKSADISLPRQQNRLTWVDHARGIAILLVVYRHVIMGMKRSGIEVSALMHGLQEITYNFRMPVFFILSGVFVAASLRRRSRLYLLKDKVYTLLYPYVLWGCITILLQIFFSRYSNSTRDFSDLLAIFTDPRVIDHLWYLLALFNTCVLFLLLNKFIKNNLLHLSIALLMHGATVTPYLSLHSLTWDLCYFYIFFVIGTIVSQQLLAPATGKRFFSVRNLLMILPLFLLGQWFWFSNAENERQYLYVFLVINIVAATFVYLVAFQLAKFASTNWLAYLGKHSIYIYIMHVAIAAAVRNVLMKVEPGMNPWIVLAVCWLCGLIIPVLMYRFLKPFGFGRLFSLKANEKQ